VPIEVVEFRVFNYDDDKSFLHRFDWCS